MNPLPRRKESGFRRPRAGFDRTEEPRICPQKITAHTREEPRYMPAKDHCSLCPNRLIGAWKMNLSGKDLPFAVSVRPADRVFMISKGAFFHDRQRPSFEPPSRPVVLHCEKPHGNYKFPCGFSMRQCSKITILDADARLRTKSPEHKSIPDPCPPAGDAERDFPRSLRTDSSLRNPQRAGGEPRPSQGCPHPKGTRAGQGTRRRPFTEKEERRCESLPIFPKKNRSKRYKACSEMVGVARLELAASWSRTKRATKLRYTP